jgi:hypothetical protein
MRWATLAEKDTRRGTEMKGNYLRIGLIFSFMVGSGIGAVLFIKYQYWGFALPIAIAGYATYKANRRAAGEAPAVT